MSEETPKTPKLQAGQEIIDSCPCCHAKFSEPVATNIEHTCPNPQCQVKFNVLVFE